MSLRKLKTRGIGRFELLTWLNHFLEMDLVTLEACRDGVAYVQVFNALYPSDDLLHRVRFNATTLSDCRHNFKLFQKALTLCRAHKVRMK